MPRYLTTLENAANVGINGVVELDTPDYKSFFSGLPRISDYPDAIKESYGINIEDGEKWIVGQMQIDPDPIIDVDVIRAYVGNYNENHTYFFVLLSCIGEPIRFVQEKGDELIRQFNIHEGDPMKIEWVDVYQRIQEAGEMLEVLHTYGKDPVKMVVLNPDRLL